MKITVRGTKGFEPGKAIEQYSEKKLEKLNKLLDDKIQEIRVVCKIYNEFQKVEVTVIAPKTVLRAEVKDKDIYSAIDISVDKLQRQLNKHKQRLQERVVKNGGIKQEVEKLAVEDFTESKNLFVRTKEMKLEPMDIEEASFQMELLGHSFFVFKNIEDEKVCILYKREDGDLALIITE